NTNGEGLVILNNESISGTPVPSNSATINGDLIVSGNSAVIVSNAQGDSDYFLTVSGNVQLNGLSFDLQSSQLLNLGVTNLIVNGNIAHNAGTFGVSATESSNTE